jgi:hypothetical protein
MWQPSFRQITWTGETQQHRIPIATPIKPGAGVLCGKRVPEFVDEAEVEDELDLPSCRRCDKAFWKIFRRARQEFTESVERDLEMLRVTDAT